MYNKKGTKRALLSSVLALVLCFSMLVGTTFAWFTDTTTAGVNTIQSGTLDIVLEYSEDGGKTWQDAEGETLNFKTADGRTSNIYWEPGCTYELPLIRVRNNGNLALKYEIVISGLTGDVKLLEAIDFYVNEEVLLDSYRGTLLENEAVSAPMLIKGHMQEEAGNEYQNLTIEGISITVYATQMAYENDSYGPNYDEKASVTIAPDESLADAIKNVEDGGIVFLETGEYNLSSGPIVIENKTVTIIGLGNVTINKNYGSTHIFTVKNGAEVTIKNVTMDGNGNTREGIYVRWNSKVVLEDVVIRNTGGSDIMIDEASDAEHGENSASYVSLINTDIEDVAMCASPASTVPAATQDTYVYFNYDKDSTVGAIDVQGINTKPKNVIINGIPSTEVGKTMQLYVANDAELASALNTINTNSEYWNKQVIINMAAGEYTGDYTINQYPEWNGVVGAGSTANNYASGVPAGAPGTVITFVGETATAYSLRAVSAPAVMFTGKVTVNGFGNAGTGFGSTFAITTFQNIAFDGKNIAPVDGDVVAVTLTAAADNIYFENCTFQNTTHLILGYRAANRINNVHFTDCAFSNAGSLSGYPLNVAIAGCTVNGADGGFLNIQNQAVVTVADTTANVGRYFIRTNGSGVELTVENSDITVYESEGTKHLVYFRGSEESAEFVDCSIADGYTTEGLDANSTLDIYNFSETEDGLTLVTDGITGDVTLYLVPADYEGTTVTVPEGVDTIGNYAFAYNSNVKEVVLASTVRDLGRGFDSSSVEKVVLNEGLTTISSRAFKATSALKEVVLSSTITTIDDDAFQKTGLKTITIPASVNYIGVQAFGASGIEEVIIEGNVTINNKAFRGCANLKTFTVKGDDIAFINVNSGSGDCWICNSESNNPGTSKITFNVQNPVVKEKILAAMGHDTTTITMNCTAEVDEETGLWTDAEGNKCAYAVDQTALSTAITNKADIVYLANGEYKMPSSTTTGNVTITGTKDTILDVTKGAYMDKTNVTITGVTIKTSTGYVMDENGNKGSDYAALYSPDTTYVNCTFVGPMRVGRDGAKFIDCTFTEMGNDYIWTYGNDVTFENCTFNTAGKAILIYSDGGNEVSQVVVKNCTFNATTGAKAGAIANQNCAAIEIHNYGNGVNLTTSGNTYDSNFSGEWRIKTYETGKPSITVNGSEYTTIAIDGKTMTIDANKNVTVNG